MTKEKIYEWMDKQIEAAKIHCTPFLVDDPWYICTAGIHDAEVHVCGIDNLCRELDEPWNVAPHNDDYVQHYIMYNGYKFFGLVNKEKNDEGK